MKMLTTFNLGQLHTHTYTYTFRTQAKTARVMILIVIVQLSKSNQKSQFSRQLPCHFVIMALCLSWSMTRQSQTQLTNLTSIVADCLTTECCFTERFGRILWSGWPPFIKRQWKVVNSDAVWHKCSCGKVLDLKSDTSTLNVDTLWGKNLTLYRRNTGCQLCFSKRPTYSERSKCAQNRKNMLL